MRYTFSFSTGLLFGSLALHAAALPQGATEPPPAGETAIPPGPSGLPQGSATETQHNNNICVNYWPPKPLGDNGPDSPAQQCKDVCGKQVADNVAAGKLASTSCISFNQPWMQANGEGKPFMGQPPSDSPPLVQGGNCSCNNAFIDELADDFLTALPIIANIGCELIMNSLELVIQVGALAIPGVGEAIDGGMIAGVEAAKLADYTYSAGEDAFSAFHNWLDPCGPSQLPPGVQDAFDIMKGVVPDKLPKGFNPPKGVEKGSGKPGDKGDPNPPKKTAPADVPKKTGTNKSPDQLPSQSAGTSTGTSAPTGTPLPATAPASTGTPSPSTASAASGLPIPSGLNANTPMSTGSVPGPRGSLTSLSSSSSASVPPDSVPTLPNGASVKNKRSRFGGARRAM